MEMAGALRPGTTQTLTVIGGCEPSAGFGQIGSLGNSGAIRERFGRFGRIWPHFRKPQLTETIWFRSLSDRPEAG